MATPHELTAALHIELQRLGLRLDELPGDGLSANADDLGDLIQRVRGLVPPVTWRDIFPDIPSHWVAGRPETWTTPYRPFGPYDHQSLPTGPAVHVSWPRSTDRSCLDRIIFAARAAGWPIHGGGFLEATNPDWPSLDAMIILDAGTDEVRFDDFREWLEQRADVELAAVPRLGNEKYVRDA